LDGGGWGDAGVWLVGVLVEGDEGTGGVEDGLEGRAVVVAETVVVGAGDDVLVGDGCGTWVVFGNEADGEYGLVEVVVFFLGVLALGNR